MKLYRVEYKRQLLVARHGRREGDEPVFGQATYISIYKVSKLLVSTPIFLSLLPLKITSGFSFQSEDNLVANTYKNKYIHLDFGRYQK